MKKHPVITLARSIMIFSLLFIATAALAQSSKDTKLITDCDSAKAEFIQTDPMLKNLFQNAYGYVIFPNVGKGAVGVGGASGNGMVYEKGKIVGKAKMSQVTVGFQFGGQAYRELIFFESKAALDEFKANDFEFSAQVSAVAATKGASGNAKFTNGILIYTQQKGGVMYEASVGGQKFKYTPN